MKNLKKVLGTLIVLLCTSLFGAERPPQRAAMQTNAASLEGLPKEIRGYLIPFIASGNIEQGLLTTATINKSFHKLINDPQIMLQTLNWILGNSRYTANVISLAKRLQQKKNTLPVMKEPQIVAWITATKNQLRDGQELINAVTMDNEEHPEIVAGLLEDKNTNLNWQDDSGTTALAYASERGFEKSVELLLKAGADPNIKDNDGLTALAWPSFRAEESRIVKLLLEGGANPNIQDTNGIFNILLGTDNTTPLIWATLKQDEKAVTDLLAAGANPNPADSAGITALMQAAFTQNAAIVQLLLAAGADPDLENQDGSTARYYAEENGVNEKSNEIIKLLNDASAQRKAKQLEKK